MIQAVLDRYCRYRPELAVIHGKPILLHVSNLGELVQYGVN